MSASSLCLGALILLALASCGNKPDGTPYGVNPAKHPDGYLRPGSTPANTTRHTVPQGPPARQPAHVATGM